MFASPFFTSGRSAILPTIATKDELHTANSLTQTTGWTTLTVGTFLARRQRGAVRLSSGPSWSTRSRSFFRRMCISRLFLPGDGFRPKRESLTEADVVRPWHEYTEGSALYAFASADLRDRADRRGLGHRRRRGADPVQHVRRDRIQSRPGGHRHRVGLRGHRAADRRRDRALARRAPVLRWLQARRLRRAT